MTVQVDPQPSIEETIRQLIVQQDFVQATTLATETYGESLGRFCLVLLHSAAEAQDALEEILVASHKSMPSYDHEQAFKIWLFGIARRICSRRQEDLRLHDRSPRPPAAVTSPPSSADDQQRLAAALIHLRPSEREALVLRFVAQLSYVEIAAVVGVDRAVVHKRASRALTQMVRHLDHEHSFEPPPTPNCSDLADHMAPLVDGDEPTVAQFADHLSDCDHCRDQRHEASNAGRKLPKIALGFGLPEDMPRRIIHAVETWSSQKNRALVLPPAAPLQPPEAAAVQHSPSRPLWHLGALAGFLVALGGLGLWVSARPSEPEVGQPSSGGAQTAAGPVAPAMLTAIVRAAADGATGVELALPGSAAAQPLTINQPVPPGATVRTDDRTRARLAVADQQVDIIVNRNSEITLDATAPRTFHLARGSEVVASTTPATDEGSQPVALVLMTPQGRVEILGTKVVLSTTEQTSTLRVTRGHARISSGAGQQAEVKAGEEAVVGPDGTISLASAIDLASSLSWSELNAGPEGNERSLSGLGELRARRPGDRAGAERSLTLARHKVTVRIAGTVARTEIEEEFRNDTDVTLEGIYSFPLPPDARIARLALDVDGRMEEGAFVERDLAAQIWRGVIRQATPQPQRQPQEEYIWVPGPWRDPALLEWQRGGQFELRIFPIPARGQRRIILAYEQTILPHGSGRRYVYPLPYATSDSMRVDQFELDLRLQGLDEQSTVAVHGYPVQSGPQPGQWLVSMSQPHFLPAGDLVVDYTLPGGTQELRWWTFQGAAVAPPGTASGGGRTRESSADVRTAQQELAQDPRSYVAFTFRPELPLRSRAKPRDYILVVDASQSMFGERFSRASQLVSGIIAEMDRQDRFVLLACDATCQRHPGGSLHPSLEAAGAARNWLATIRPAGASDLTAILAEAAQVGQGQSSGRELRVLYLGDGVSTVGHRRPASLAAITRALAQRHALSVTTVGIGTDADALTLSALARSAGGHYIPYVPGQGASAAALRVLESTYGVSLNNATLEFPPGITDVAPLELPTLRAGEELTVSARFSGEVQGQVVLRGTVGGEPYEDRYPIQLRATEAAGNAFVPRLWAAASIDQLELKGRGEDRPRIVGLSRGFGVMSRQTSLLVLESEAMFRAFGVDRSRPALQWTGEEEQETGESTGTEEHEGPTLLESAAASPAVRGMSAGRRMARSGGGASGAMDLDGLGLAPSAAPRASAPAAEPELSRAFDAPAERARAEARVQSDLQQQRQPMPRRPVRPGGQWMRRVWERSAEILPDVSERPRDRQAVQAAEAALQGAPDSRDRHRDLFRALSRLGDIDRAETVAEEWLRRDQLDPEALVALADTLARQGNRELSLRLLTGVVDLQPDSEPLQQRLIEAFERAGLPERACRHRIALAENSQATPEIVGAALRCARGLGQDQSAQLLLDGLTEGSLRSRVEQVASVPPRDRGPYGDLVLQASWAGPQDLDVALIDARGQRISWMGGRGRVFGEGALVPSSERLGLRWIPAGTYLIEVTRTRPDDTIPVSGQVGVRVLGQQRSLSFQLTGLRVLAGRVAVNRESRLVPVR